MSFSVWNEEFVFCQGFRSFQNCEHEMKVIKRVICNSEFHI